MMPFQAMRLRKPAGGAGGGVPGPIPTFQALAGPTNTNGTASRAWPTHAIGDLGILIVKTANEAPGGAVSGWTQFAQIGAGTPGVAGAAMLTLYWRVAASTSEPSASVPDAGAQILAWIMTFRGAHASTPIDASGTGTSTSSPIPLPSITTTDANRLVLCVAADGALSSSNTRYSAWTNAALSSFTERADDGTGVAPGGGMGAASGGKATAGSTAAGSVNFALSSANFAAISVAIRPVDV